MAARIFALKKRCPALAADEVLVRVRLCAHRWHGPQSLEACYHAKMMQPPAVLAYELVGEIVAVGNVLIRAGASAMRVIPQTCALSALLIIAARPGKIFATTSFQQRSLRRLHAHPPHRRRKYAGKSASLSTIRAPRSPSPLLACSRNPRDGVRTGDTAAVIGCGPIGLKFVRMLSRRGVRVIALAPAFSAAGCRQTLGCGWPPSTSRKRPTS